MSIHIAGAHKPFKESLHRRFRGRFASMGLSARKLEQDHGVKIKGLGAAKPRYEVTHEGKTLGHVVRGNDGRGKELFHVETPQGHHPEGPFETRAMAGAAVADLAGKLPGADAAPTPARDAGKKPGGPPLGGDRVAAKANNLKADAAGAVGAAMKNRAGAEAHLSQAEKDRIADLRRDGMPRYMAAAKVLAEHEAAKNPRKAALAAATARKKAHDAEQGSGTSGVKLVKQKDFKDRGIDGTRHVQAKYDVHHNGVKIGEVHKVKHYERVLDGRIQVGLRHDMTGFEYKHGEDKANGKHGTRAGRTGYNVGDAKGKVEEFLKENPDKLAAAKKNAADAPLKINVPPTPGKVTDEQPARIIGGNRQDRNKASKAPDNLVPNKDGSRFKAGLAIRAYGKYDGKHLGFDKEGNHHIEMTMADGSKQHRNVGKVEGAYGTKPISIKAGANKPGAEVPKKGDHFVQMTDKGKRSYTVTKVDNKIHLEVEDPARGRVGETTMTLEQYNKAKGEHEARVAQNLADVKAKGEANANRNIDKAAVAAKAQAAETNVVGGVAVHPDTPPYIVEELKRGEPFAVTGPLKAAGVERVTVDNTQNPQEEDPDNGIFVYMLMKDGTVHASEFKNRWNVNEESVLRMAREGGDHRWGK